MFETRRSFFCLVAVIGVLGVLSLFARCGYGKGGGDMDWPEITKESRPWARWWWLGNAVDKENLSRQLREYAQKGFGGLEVATIYGVKGYEDRFIEYLSPEWVEMLKYTVGEAERAGLGIDMTCGCGWPFGGPQIGDEDAAVRVNFKSFTVEGGAKLSEKLPTERI